MRGQTTNGAQLAGLPARGRTRLLGRERERSGDGDAGLPACRQAVQETGKQPVFVGENVAPGSAITQIVAGGEMQINAHRAAPVEVGHGRASTASAR